MRKDKLLTEIAVQVMKGETKRHCHRMIQGTRLYGAKKVRDRDGKRNNEGAKAGNRETTGSSRSRTEGDKTN
jgi:hypothetical protein